MLRALLPFAPFVLAASLSTGCATTYIPNTDVEDSAPNRKVISFCEDYRRAVEEKNVGRLLQMASPHYHEDGGNTNGDDDIDYDGLRDYLTTTFTETQGLRYEIRYRVVTFAEGTLTPNLARPKPAADPNKARRIYVDYSYAASFRVPNSGNASGQEWKHTVADNRLELVPDGDSYKILAGM